MKRILPVLLISIGLSSPAWAQRSSPAAASPTPTASGTASPAAAAPAARTDLYHVNFSRAAVGKAADQAENLKKQDPDAPMPGHFIVLRHQDGDDWDYCTIEHLGTKATVDAARPAMPAAQTGSADWHTDTYVSGPSWADFAKELGLDDPSKSTTSAYVVAVYRPAPGQRDGLDKFLNEPPDRAVDTSSGNVVMQHIEGAAWTFLAVTRYNSWNDFAKNEVNSIAQMSKPDAGWFKLRSYVSYHSDTLCDRIAP